MGCARQRWESLREPSSGPRAPRRRRRCRRCRGSARRRPEDRAAVDVRPDAVPAAPRRPGRHDGLVAARPVAGAAAPGRAGDASRTRSGSSTRTARRCRPTRGRGCSAGPSEEIGILAYSALFLAEDVTASDPAARQGCGRRAGADRARRPGRRARRRPRRRGTHRRRDERPHPDRAGRLPPACRGRRADLGCTTRCSTTRSTAPTTSCWSTRTSTDGRPRRLRRCTCAGTRADGMAATYLASFERVWSAAKPFIG